MTFVIGLTGSIGMGKSTTAKMFAQEGIPVWDADETVERLYGQGGAAVRPIKEICPAAIIDEQVNKEKLRHAISKDATLLDQLNRIVHPLVRADREVFIEQNSGRIILLDIPLLFETGADEHCDIVVVVTAPADRQRERVLARGEMTQAQFNMILERQMPDREKRERADVVIQTITLEDTRERVQTLIAEIKQDHKIA